MPTSVVRCAAGASKPFPIQYLGSGSVTLKDKVSNGTVRSIFVVIPIAEKMKEVRLRWFGHALRREENAVAKTALKLDVSSVR
ncbi:hypothetical protein NECAME_04143 [Necator americanus]|uniref:Uncharacterized protein n=1 Tax=Necator americanus TaxID=51031 RepID=W2SWH4_NECAM|nr:hypothetical protein NECAME_04143 [Necator americanus]ETN74114.1 hypothetical protein NECAME_04143 [Necator americanus]